MTLTHVVLAASMLLTPAAVMAQDLSPLGSPESAANEARVRVGPLALNPTFALRNIGIDTNVFNDPVQAQPKSDFTMTVAPAADVYLRLDRAWFTSTIREDLVYYKEYENQRGANTYYTGALYFPLNRLTLRAGGGYVNATDRPGFEIDTRVHRTERTLGGAADFRALPTTYVGVRASQQRVKYDDEQFQGASLQQQLNRTETLVAGTVRHELTPLTTLTFEVSHRQDRFEYEPLRDANSTHVVGGVILDKYALIRGSAQFGVRDFAPQDPSVKEFRGGTMAVNLSYVAFETTKLTLAAARDVQYSYDVNQPYYLQTGGTVSIAQQVYGPFEVTARAGLQHLDYQTRTDVVVAVPNRTDRVEMVGGGAGYRFGQDVHVDFTVDNQFRSSALDSRTYTGLRYGFSVTYGL